MAKAWGVVHFGQRMVAVLAVMVLTWAMVGCAKPTEPTVLLSEPTEAPHLLAGPMAEVSPPETLDTLKQIIDAYRPQVRILSPRPGEVVESATVSVRFQVRGLPLFKDETWQLGPHLHVFLDDQPYQAVYDASAPLILEDLAPGTHTLRVFASRPWHESFKNQGAFDQRTFHVFAPTPQNEVNASTPLLTYSRPQGSYGAEPIMLDFYLTNAPLHLSAQADPKDDLHDWRVRCTVNGQSFVFDQWQPIYLKGFQPGRNWVQLELIDETGRPIENRFNNTVRVIDYQPGGTDTLSRLVRGELDLKTVASIIDPTYTPPASPNAPGAAPGETQDEATPLEAADPELTAPPAQQSEEAMPQASPPEEPDPGEPDIGAPDLENPAPDHAAEARPAAEKAVPVPVEETPPFRRPLTEEEADAEDLGAENPDAEKLAPESPDAQNLGLENLGTEDNTESDNAPLAPPLMAEDGQTQSQTQSQTQGTTLPDPAAPGAKGIMQRWKRWADQQTLPSFGSSQPEIKADPAIPVYEVPADPFEAGEANSEQASDASPSDADDLPRAMPETIEPYLTQPYMTEPRLEIQPLPPEAGEGETPDPGVGSGDRASETGGENLQADTPSTPPNLSPTGRSSRPYI